MSFEPTATAHDGNGPFHKVHHSRHVVNTISQYIVTYAPMLPKAAYVPTHITNGADRKFCNLRLLSKVM